MRAEDRGDACWPEERTCCVQLRAGMIAPDLVVDIKRIRETREIREDGGVLVVGAAVTRSRVGRACRREVDVAGGSSKRPSSSARPRSRAGHHLPAISATHPPRRIRFPLWSPLPQGARWRARPVRDASPSRTCARDPGSSRSARESSSSHSSFPNDRRARLMPICDSFPAPRWISRWWVRGVNLVLDESGRCAWARVALGAVAPTVVLVEEAGAALVGTECDDTALEAMAAAARAACRPIDDKRGTAEYRTKVAGVLAIRAARTAVERARRAR